MWHPRELVRRVTVDRGLMLPRFRTVVPRALHAYQTGLARIPLLAFVRRAAWLASRACRSLSASGAAQAVCHDGGDDRLQDMNRPALPGLARTGLHFALGDSKHGGDGADVDGVQCGAVQRANGDWRHRQRQVAQRRIYRLAAEMDSAH